MKFSTLALIAILFVSEALSAKTYTLNEAKNQLMDDSVSISIAYEKYVMAKQQSRAKVLELLPTISVDLLIYDYNYTILRALIPEPSRFFEASASKELAKAAEVNQLVVKRNLLADLEKSFYLIKYNEEVIDSLKESLEIKEEILDRTQSAYDLGAIDYFDVYNARRDVIKSQTELFNAKEILSAERFAFKLIMSRKNPTESLELVSPGFYNENLDYPLEIDYAMDVAVHNSKELDSYTYMLRAAEKSKKGEKWSWLSWAGVGFDYFARIDIAKANIRKIEHERRKSVIGIRNQVASLYEKIEAHKYKMELHAELAQMARTDYELMQADVDNLMTTVLKLRKTELGLIGSEIESRKLKYELEILYIELKRALGAYMISNEIPRA